MSQFSAVIVKVVGAGGPFAYLVSKDGVPQTDVNGVTTLGLALDGVKTSITGLVPGGETVQRVTLNAVSAP